MQITFSGEAGETFQKLVSQLATFTVQIEVEVEDAPNEVFDVTLVGLDHGSEWYDAVHVRRQDGDGNEITPGPGLAPVTESVRALSIHVY